ncbi:hypothetical protein ACQ4PT_060075 [Festuca glaucescens]
MMASCGGGSGKVATMESSGGGSGKPPGMVNGCGGGLAKPAAKGTCKAMRHGIEIPEGVSLSHVLHFLLTNRMDPAISFLLNLRMDTYQVALDGSTRRFSEFDYPLIVESSMNFNEVQRAMCNKYPWVVDPNTVNVNPKSPPPVNDSQPPTSVGASQKNQRKKTSSDANDIAYDDSALPDLGVHSEDEDERMYPDIVPSNHDYIPAIYASTDDEEDQEYIDMGGFEDREIQEDADRPIVEYEKNDPSMDEGTVFRSVIDCRNALATFAIVREFDYITEKSDPTRLRAHCAFEGCRWRIHASFMKNSKLFQVNPCEHTCPTALESEKLLAAKSRWVCDIVLEWVRENPTIGVSKLIEKIHEKYRIKVPYMRVSSGREKAMDKLVDKWADSFHLLYTFKAEVESKLKKVKALQLVDMFDCLRQRSVVKFELRRRIAERLEGHRILLAVVKALNEKTRGLNLTCLKRNDYEAEVTGTDKEGRQWR